MKSLLQITVGSSVGGAASWGWSLEPCPLERISTPQSTSYPTREEGLFVECSLDQFTAMVDWVPLYTQEGLEKYLPMALSSFASTGAPRLIAIVPPECRVGTDKEFLLSNFHWHRCLMRQSFNLGGRCRQLAFCPYSGVINENSDTALSHMRKHLDLHFVCRGCYSKSFLNGPALHRHMRTQCPSVMAIRDQSRTSRRQDSL